MIRQFKICSRVWTLALAGVGLLCIAGCSKKEIGEGDFMPAEGGRRDISRIMAAQAAAGAYADAMLQPMHFDGPGLNALGRQKLQLMLAHRPAGVPMAVYLDLPSDDAQASPRRQSVEQYLASAGLPSSDLRIEHGANPDTLHPAQPELANLPKTETQVDEQAGSESQAGMGGNAAGGSSR